MLRIDTSPDLVLTRCRNGVKLIRPQNNQSCNLAVANLLKLQFPIYFNADEFIINCNESCAEVNGFISREDSLGQKWFKPYKLETITETLRHQNDVVRNHKYKIIEDILVRKDDTNIHALSFKMPWYDNENKIIGLFGCSIFLGKQPIAESLSQIANLGLLDQVPTPINVNKDFTIPNMGSISHLSPREKECLQYYLQNYTAKQTATILGLSYRTIEEYFTNIKKKLGCRYKRDLFNILD